MSENDICSGRFQVFECENLKGRSVGSSRGQRSTANGREPMDHGGYEA